ncbi:lipase 3-like [Copidosoma floridanum]|uniref:lipase 3-like n=1 Tax=Copidosoma floridanum TaxID=29053 RepID=UPI000C6F6D6E|nr:lipase 3-like [Copidosoma floridanum]
MIFFSQVELLTRLEGHLIETHSVTTEDGYILTLHRLPGPANSTPVYIQHGLLESSTDWLVAGKKSFPHILADHGYDVWLGNARGNTYSKKHKKLSFTDRRFWDFRYLYT